MARDPEKTKVGVWLTPDERKALAKTLEFLGIKTFADLARKLITASDWPQSRLEALAALFDASKAGARDARAATLLIRLRPAELNTLGAVAEDAQIAPEEYVYDLVRKELRIPHTLGGGNFPAQVIGPLDVAAEVEHLKHQISRLESMAEVERNRAGGPRFKPSKLAGEDTPFKRIKDDESTLNQKALAATIDALKDDPEGLVSVERALDGLTQSEGLTDIVYHGHPDAQGVHQVLRSLAKLSVEVDQRLQTRKLPSLHMLRRTWARLMLGAKSSEQQDKP